MTRLPVFACTMMFFVTVQPALPSDQFLELSTTKTVSLQVIGTVPPKRHIELDLGELRTENARLPDGERDLEARKRLRARRALARQSAVTNARRNKTIEAENAAGEKEESETKSDLAKKSVDDERKTAKAENPKIIKSYKNNKKSSGGRSGKRPPPIPSPAGQASIE